MICAPVFHIPPVSYVQRGLRFAPDGSRIAVGPVNSAIGDKVFATPDWPLARIKALRPDHLYDVLQLGVANG